MSQVYVQVHNETALQRFARSYLHLVSNAGAAVVGGGVSILLGFSPLPASFPLLALAREHPTLALTAGGALALLLAMTITLAQRGRLADWLGGQAGLGLLRFLFAATLSALGSALIGVVLGFSALPSSIPLLDLIRTRPPVGITLMAILLGLIILSPLLGPDEDPRGSLGGRGPSPHIRLWLSSALSLLSSALFIGLLATVLVRPAWCPGTICPPGEYFPPDSAHDANLLVVYTAEQTTTYMIPGDPAQYAGGQGALPTQASAVRIDEQYPPYRAVFKVSSRLHGTQPGLIIAQVVVVLDRVSLPPDPLNVYYSGGTPDYHSNLYEVNYRGESAGARLVASSTNMPPTYVDLQASEQDEIEVQLTSQQVGGIQYHLEVLYRLKNRSEYHTLAVPHEFAVAFGTAANWHLYAAREGGFIPAAP